MPSVINKTKFFFFICSFSILMGCHTPLPPATKTAAQKLQKRVFLVYTSDNLNFLPYFSLPFTERLKHEFIIANSSSKAEDAPPPDIPEEAEPQRQHSGTGQNLEKVVGTLLTNIRSSQQNQVTLEQAYHTCLLANERIRSSFLLEHEPLNRKTLVELSFWCSVVSHRLQRTLKDNLSLYAKYTSLAFKDSLENQIDSATANALHATIKKFHLTQQKQVRFEYPTSCRLLVNGEPWQGHVISLPEQLESVVSAVCHNGSFATAFTPHNTNKVTVLPLKHPSTHQRERASVSKMPSLRFDKDAQFAISIHWAQEKKYLDCRVESLPNFIPVDSLHLPLTTQAALNESGDTLLVFLKNALK